MIFLFQKIEYFIKIYIFGENKIIQMTFFQNSVLTKEDFDEKVFIKLSAHFAQDPNNAILKSLNYIRKI